jgi:hypothetical protein
MGLTRAVATALATGITAFLAPAAGAVTLPTGCGGLKKTIATAAADPNHGEGDTVVLTGMCNAANLKSSTGVVLPALANFSIEGAAGTTSGFDGAGVTESLLRSEGFEAVGALTLRNLTFEHAATSASRGGALSLTVGRLTLADDSFIENVNHGAFGAGAYVFVPEPKAGCPASTSPPAVAVTGSTFRSNTLSEASVADGAGLWISTICALPGYLFEDNTFEGNTIELGGSGEALGAGLMFENVSSSLPSPVAQRDNMFDSNRILGASAESDFGGGGEWLEGASVSSAGERFSRNAIPGSEGSHWSWGGGLGILNTNCNAATATESTLANAVVAGNSIGAGTPGDLAGAGVYVGCSPSSTHPNHLALLDSTVTENRVGAGGVAGVAGNPGDQLILANSIVASNSGGDEVGGFTGPGGSLSASSSDVCAPGGASPLPGAGNICADPMLIDAGDPASFDVRETPASPTVDAGSNPLVPAGLTTDHYGATRIQAARSFLPPCHGSGSTAYTLGPAVVDMGAGELGPQPVPLIAILCPAPVPRSSFSFPALVQRAAGALVLAFKGLAAGRLTVLATFRLTRTIVHTVKGRRHRTHRTETVTYGHATHTAAVAGDVALALKPNRRALALLRHRRRLNVTFAITFAQPGLLPSTQTRVLSVRYIAPRHRHR